MASVSVIRCDIPGCKNFVEDYDKARYGRGGKWFKIAFYETQSDEDDADYSPKKKDICPDHAKIVDNLLTVSVIKG